MKRNFGLGLLVGIILTIILVWIFKHKLVKWYAQRYSTHFAEAVEIGVKEFVEKFLPDTDIGIGRIEPVRKGYIPFSLN